MLPANLLTSLKALGLDNKPLITTAPDKGSGNTASFEIGQKIQASVQAQTAPGTFNVRVADQLLSMQLPPFIRSGDAVMLQVVALQPKLTFGIAASANPLSTPDQLSPTAKLLSSLSQQPLENRFVRAAQSAPLWVGAQTQPDPTDLAGKLQTALGQSGLFYESHQAQWVEGGRSTQQLLHEPQNQLSLATTTPAATSITNQAQTSDAQNKAMLVSTTSATGNAAAALAQNPAVLSIPDPLQPLVQQQLNALETRQVLWQGQVWPEQEMRWAIQEDTPHTRANGELEPQWATEIELDLPHLGPVAATLRFGGNGLSLTLSAADADTRQLFNASTAQLIAALSDRGLPVTHTQVTRNEFAG